MVIFRLKNTRTFLAIAALCAFSGGVQQLRASSLLNSDAIASQDGDLSQLGVSAVDSDTASDTSSDAAVSDFSMDDQDQVGGMSLDVVTTSADSLDVNLEPFASIGLGSLADHSDSPLPLGFGIVTDAIPAVPEPATLPLCALALAVIGFGSRRSLRKLARQ
jgi:PEP-CTERM motif